MIELSLISSRELDEIDKDTQNFQYDQSSADK